MKEYQVFYTSPVGVLRIKSTDIGITVLDILGTGGVSDKNLPKVMIECLRQLDEYFSGERKNFDVDLDFNGTDFQKSVWNQLTSIPYGKTICYSDIAKRIKSPNSCRAVGLANNKNKIAIIIPCHRVVGKDGAMVGYASGVWRKEWLLEHENSHSE